MKTMEGGKRKKSDKEKGSIRKSDRSSCIDCIDDWHIEGTWRSEKLGFDKVKNKILFSVECGNLAFRSTPFENDPLGQARPQDRFKSKDFNPDVDWVLWSLPPIKYYKKVLKEAHCFYDKKIPWIFVSSTSVYDAGEVDETSKRQGKRFRGENLIEIEDLLYDFKRPISIVRPSGLVDEKRNPALQTFQRIALKGERVNLVHTRDVARFLVFLLKNNLQGEDFNLNSHTDYEKSYFYNQILTFMGESPIDFSNSSSMSPPKRVNAEKSRAFGFQYLYEDLLEYYRSLK